MIWAPCISGEGGRWVGGMGVSSHACTWTHTHAPTCVCVNHDNFIQMATPIGGIIGNSLWCHMHMHVHRCVCMCVCVNGTSPTHQHPPCPIYPPPPPPGGGPWSQLKFNNTLTNWDNLILFEDFESVEAPHSWVGVWFGRWVDVWVG